MTKGVQLSQYETKRIKKMLSNCKSTCFFAKKMKRDHRTIKQFIEKVVSSGWKPQNLNQGAILLHKLANWNFLRLKIPIPPARPFLMKLGYLIYQKQPNMCAFERWGLSRKWSLRLLLLNYTIKNEWIELLDTWSNILLRFFGHMNVGSPWMGRMDGC